MPEKTSPHISTENIDNANRYTDNLAISVYPPTHKKEKPPSKYRKLINWTIGSAVLAAIYAHFIWATWYFIEKTESTLDSTTCTGYGFWMIVFIFINFGVAYKFVLKKYLIPPIERYMWPLCSKKYHMLPPDFLLYFSWLFLSSSLLTLVMTGGD
ncbi:uncharacterized protein LOC135138060 isoform X1 [Zophobas morio]|uniref:uncharacterized protein LOC135138060 isoform X1 n=1 Tax=Zophobas morio TaxID=2755281 RepID=UPI003083A2F0